MKSAHFFGRTIVASAFVMAVFGWGIGFYGPPIFLYAVVQRTGWSVALCSGAVTLHFLAGTLLVANLPAVYRWVGLPRLTVLGSVLLGMGVYGWAIAREPYQLFLAAMLSGLGWVTLGAAAINSLIAPWFVVKRPAALAMAYNGASVGGIIFSSAWVYLINSLGFPVAALLVGALSIALMGALSLRVFSVLPEHLGQHPDGVTQPPATRPLNTRAPEGSLWRNRQFITLALGMSLGLFAQIGLLTHLFLLLVPHLSEQKAGLAIGLATASAIVGRLLIGRFMPLTANRRTVACLSYAIQLLGCVIMIGLDANPGLVWLGVILFGAGIGNATSLPPLIAQTEFPPPQTQRVIALIVATSQGCYAFAPTLFAAVRALGNESSGALLMFGLAAGIQGLAILALMMGKRLPHPVQQ